MEEVHGDTTTMNGKSRDDGMQQQNGNHSNGVENDSVDDQHDSCKLLVQQRSVDNSNNMSDMISQSLQMERQELQANTYISWLNYRLQQVPESPQITNLFEDLRDGKLLLALLSLLTGKTLKPLKGNMRVHHLNNLDKVLQVLEQQKIKLVGIHNESICDGHAMYTLGLIWRIIYHFQVVQSMSGDETDSGGAGSAETALLQWCAGITKDYPSAEAWSFQPKSWKNGYLLNALVHSFDKKLFDYSTTVEALDDDGRLQHALNIGYNHYGVPKLFTVDDFEKNLVDNKTLILYVSMLREKLNALKDDEKQQAQSVFKRLELQVEEVKQQTNEKEASELIHVPPDLSFEESKKYCGEYKKFLKELQNDVNTLQNVEENLSSLTDSMPAEDIETMRNECQDLSQRVTTLQDKGTMNQETLKQKRVELVEEKLKSRSEELTDIRKEVDKLLPRDLNKGTSKEKLESCEVLSKELLGKMSQMQIEMKSTCALVDVANKDKSLKKEIRSELKNKASAVLEEYADVMTSIKNRQSKAKSLLGDRLKDVEEKFTDWKDRVGNLETWLGENVDKYEKIEPNYNDLDELKDTVTEVKELLSRMRGETWKEFEEIALTWNGLLCDEVNDDKYADVLSGIQTKFNQLHQVATEALTITDSMVKQKTGEAQLIADLEDYNNFVDQNLQLVCDGNQHDDNDISFEEIQNLFEEIKSKDGEVMTFLNNSRLLLEGNTFDDEQVQHVQTNLEEFADRWEDFKEACTEKHITMSHSDQLRRVQRETARNLTESLQEWKDKLREYTERLHTITLKQYTTLEEVNVAVEELELLHSDVGSNDEALEEYDRDTNILLDTLEERESMDLSANHFQKFFKEWEDLKGDVQLQLTSLKEETRVQFEEEYRLMKEWEDKLMLTEDLIKVQLAVEKFCNEPETLNNYDEYLEEFDALEAKVMTNVDVIESNLAEFEDLRKNQLKIEENREKVKVSEESIIVDKNNLLEKLVEAKKTVILVVESMKTLDQKEEEVRTELEKWQKKLDDNNDTLDRCDINQLISLNDTLKAIDILEALLAQIGTHDASFSVFETSSSKDVETLRSDSSAELTPILRNLSRNWDLCLSKAEERLNGLRVQLTQLEKNETKVMTGWKEKAVKTTTWLDEAIAETHSYCQLPQQQFDLQKYLQQFQEVVNKVSTRLEFVSDQKEHGHHLVESNQVQKQINKDAVLADVKAMSHKERVLQANLSTAHTMNNILRDRLVVRNETARNIDESIVEWQVLLDMFTDRLNDIDISYEKGQNDIQKTINSLKVLFADVKSHQEKLDAFKENSALLIETLSTEQAGKASATCQLFFKNWNFNWNNLSERLNLMEIKAHDDLAESAKISAEWQISSNFIDNWLNSAEHDIDLYVKTGDLELESTTEMANTYHVKAEEFLISEATPRDLVTRLEEEGKEISEKIDHYLKVATEANYEGLEDVGDYQLRKIVLNKKLLNAAKLLDEVDADLAEAEVIKSALNSWWEMLQAKTQLFEEIETNLDTNKPEALRQLTELITEAEIKSPEIETFITNSSETLEQSPFFKELMSALKDDIHRFHTEWNKSVQLLQDAKITAEKRIAEENDIMTDWHKKRMVMEKIFTMDEEVSVYAESPIDLDDYEGYLSKFEELESKVLSSSSVVDENMGKGSEIHDDIAVSQDNKEKIKNVLEAFTHKKTKMQENLVTARKMVSELVDKKRKQKEYEEEFQLSFTDWQRILEEWTATLNECTIDRSSTVMESKMVVSILENLLTDINSHDSKLDEFHQRAEELLASLDTEKSLTWKMELKLFMNSYHHLKDKVNDRLSVFQNSVNMRLSQYQGNESAIMEEWTPSVIKTLAWLKDAERECAVYSVLPEDHMDIHKFLAEFEGLSGKIHAKLEYIKEQKDHGRELVMKLKEQINKDNVNNGIVKIEEGEEQLLLTLSETKRQAEDEIRSIVLKRVDAFWEWLPTVQKRSEERQEIGPDFDAVAKQIQEMKVIEAQTIQMSFSGLLDPYKSNSVLAFLTEKERTSLRSANEEWIKIKNWVDKRLDILSRAEEYWNDFKVRKLDLVEYLRDTEKELKAVIGIDLNDTETVERRSASCVKVMEGMEARKGHVARLTDTSDKLINLLVSVDHKSDGENTLPNMIRSQVADLLDSWNVMVKRSIEIKSKLHACVKTFDSCYSLCEEVTYWVDECVHLLNRFTADTSGEHIEILKVKLEAKQIEEEVCRRKLEDLNELDDELSREGDVCPTYTLPGNLNILNKDFTDTMERLDELNTFFGKVKMLSRRVRGGTTKLARRGTSKLARSFSSSRETTPSETPSETLSETPSVTPSETPGETPSETPSETK